jgi:hypothetical protein
LTVPGATEVPAEPATVTERRSPMHRVAAILVAVLVVGGCGDDGAILPAAAPVATTQGTDPTPTRITTVPTTEPATTPR